MIKNQDGTYIYLTIPEQYKCVYEKILVKLSDLGIDIVKDCGATCRGINRSVINCWNMFQAACAAYNLGEEKKAHLLMHYINVQLNLGCPCIEEPDKPEPKPTPNPTITNFKLNISESYTGSQTVSINSATFTITNPENAKDGTGKIVLSTGKEIKTGLGVTSHQSFAGVSFALTQGQQYSFYYQIEANDGTIIKSNTYTVTCNPPKVDDTKYNYYGTNEDITLDKITSGTKTSSNSIARVPTPTKVVWFAIPNGKSLIIDNADFAGDYFYNPNQGYTNNRLQAIQQTTINNVKYDFYKFVYFVNIEINLKVTIQ